MTSPFTLPESLVDEARRKREDSWLDTLGSELDSTVKQGMGALTSVARGAAEAVSPFAQALERGGLSVPSVDDLTPEWIKAEQKRAQQPTQNIAATPAADGVVQAQQPSSSIASGPGQGFYRGPANPEATDPGIYRGSADERIDPGIHRDGPKTESPEYGPPSGSLPSTIAGTSRPERIASAAPIAQDVERRTRFPSAVNLAFAVHESGLEDRYGPGFNYHGRQALPGEDGTPYRDWSPGANGQRVEYAARLKRYGGPSESFNDFATLITTAPRYRDAWEAYQRTGDQAQLIRGIWAAGYGESPTGADETINILQNQTSGQRPTAAPGRPASMPQQASRAATGTLDVGGITAAYKDQPYVFGGAGGRSDPRLGVPTDCSGFVAAVWKNEYGIDLPAHTDASYNQLRQLGAPEVAPKDARPGDVVYYMGAGTGGAITHHMGIYAGPGRVLDMSVSGGSGVRERAIDHAGRYVILRDPRINPEQPRRAETPPPIVPSADSGGVPVSRAEADALTLTAAGPTAAAPSSPPPAGTGPSFPAGAGSGDAGMGDMPRVGLGAQMEDEPLPDGQPDIRDPRRFIPERNIEPLGPALRGVTLEPSYVRPDTPNRAVPGEVVEWTEPVDAGEGLYPSGHRRNSPVAAEYPEELTPGQIKAQRQAEADARFYDGMPRNPGPGYEGRAMPGTINESEYPGTHNVPGAPLSYRAPLLPTDPEASTGAPYDPDQGPREAGYTDPTLAGLGAAGAPVLIPPSSSPPPDHPDPDAGPREALPGSVGAQSYLGPLSNQPEPVAQPAEPESPLKPLYDLGGRIVGYVQAGANALTTPPSEPTAEERARNASVAGVEPGQRTLTTPPRPYVPTHPPVMSTAGEPDYVPPTQTIGTMLEQGRPDLIETRIRQINDIAIRDQGLDPNNLRNRFMAAEDPAWRAANPERAAEYDDLQMQYTMTVAGQVGDTDGMRRAGQAAANLTPQPRIVPEDRALIPRTPPARGEVLPPSTDLPAQAWGLHRQAQDLQRMLESTPATAPEREGIRARLVEARNGLGEAMEDIEARVADAEDAVREADRAWFNDPRARAGRTYDEIVGEPLAELDLVRQERAQYPPSMPDPFTAAEHMRYPGELPDATAPQPPTLLGRARAAAAANAERVAAADARMAAEGSTVAPGTLGVAMGTDAQGVARRRVVPPEVADQLDFPLRVPDDPAFVRAVEAAGGRVDPERGVDLHVIRQQDEAGAGRTATRGAVFYTAGAPGAPSPYTGTGGPKAVGGNVRVEGPTRFRGPLVLSDAPGDARGFEEGMRLLAAPKVQEAQRSFDAELEAYHAITAKHGSNLDTLRANRDALEVPDAFEVHDDLGNVVHRASGRVDAYEWAERNGMPSPRIVRVPDGDLTAWREADRALQEVFQARRRLQEARRAVTEAGRPPTSTEISDAIREARKAGPPGSQERARALRNLVERYGGDPNLVDEAMTLRGDSEESTWAIKENILAHNARKAGYDGVLTVQRADSPPWDIISKDPEYVAAAQKAEQARQAHNDAVLDAEQARKLVGASARSGQEAQEFLDNLEAARIEGQSIPAWLDARAQKLREAEQRLTETRAAQDEAMRAAEEIKDRIWEQHGAKITELMDVREGANPTPGKPNVPPEVEQAYEAAAARSTAAQQRVDEIQAALDEAGKRLGQGGMDDFRAVYQAVAAAKQELADARSEWTTAFNALQDALDAPPGPSGYTLRGDIRRRGGEMDATAVAGTLPATRTADPLAAVNRVLGQGVMSGVSGTATGLVNQELHPDDPNAFGTGFVAGAVAPPLLGRAGRAAARRMGRSTALEGGARIGLGDVPPSRVNQGALPGLEPPPTRIEYAGNPDVSDAPNRPRVLGDVPPSAIRQGGLPGMEAPAPRPIGEVASDLAVTPEQRIARANQALEQFPQAKNWYERARMRNERRMQARGIEPVSPLRWVADMVGNVGYSAMLGPSTLSVNLFTGLAGPLWNMPKEFARGVMRAARTGNTAALREQGQMHAGALYGLSQLGEAVVDVIRGRGRFASNPNFPTLSERTADPLARLVAQATEFPGRVWTGLPDAIFGTIALHSGQAREAAQIATEMGLKGKDWSDEVAQMLGDARAVLKGELAPSTTVQRVVDAGNQYAKRETYRDDLGKVGQIGQKVARLGNTPVIGPWASPFYTSIWNGGLRMAEKSPLAAIPSVNVPGVGRTPEIKNASKFDRAYDVIVGSAVLYALANYAKGGGVTGSGPADPKERELLQEKGWTRYSTLTTGPDGEQYYVPNRAYQLFETPLNVAGEIHDAFAYQKPDATGRQKFDDAARRLGEVIRQNPYALSGITSILDAYNYGPASFVAEQATRLTPFAATTRAIGTAGDTMERTTDRGKDVDIADEIVQRWQQSVGARSGLPEAQDAFGQPKPNEQPGGWAFVPRIRQAREAPVADIFRAARAAPGNPKTEIRPIADDPDLPMIPLAPRERRQWDQERGKILRRVGERLVGHPKWDGAPLETRQEFLRDFMREASEAADEAMRARIGGEEIKRRVRQQIEQKRKAG